MTPTTIAAAGVGATGTVVAHVLSPTGDVTLICGTSAHPSIVLGSAA